MLRITQVPDATGRSERNDRIAAVPASDARLTRITSVKDLSERVCREVEQFFRAVVAFEPKTITVEGWADAVQAVETVKACSKRNEG